MKIIVTGSEGSLAQMLIPKLIERGHEVVGVDNFCRHGIVHRQREYELVRADLTDSSAVKEVFIWHEADVVFHLAALVYGVVGFHRRPADIIVDNNLMTMNLLKYGREEIKKFVYLSSSMAYERCTTYPHREEDADRSAVMSTSYGLSKYIGERVAKSFHEQYGTAYTIWRPFNIITPYEEPEDSGFSHVFSDMVRKIILERQRPLEVLGDGGQIRCFTSIYDVADAISKFSLDPRSDNETFNVGNPEPLTVNQLARLIAEVGKEKGVLPKDYELEFKCLPIYEDDVKKRIPDVSKMERVFGWKAKIKVRESVGQYVDRFARKLG